MSSIGVDFNEASDFDLFTLQTVSIPDNTITKTIVSGEGVYTGTGGAGDDRRLYLYGDLSFTPEEVEVLIRIGLTVGSPGLSQTGLVMNTQPESDAPGIAPIAWTNAIFGASGVLLHGVWQYQAHDLISINQHAVNNYLFGTPAVSIVGSGTTVTVTTTLPHMVSTGDIIQIVSADLGMDTQFTGGITVLSSTQFRVNDTHAGTGTGYYRWVVVPTGSRAWIRARLVGQILTTRYWLDGMAEPTEDDTLRTVSVVLPFDLSEQSQTLPTSGQVGLVVAHTGSGGQIIVNDFSATDLAPPVEQVVVGDTVALELDGGLLVLDLENGMICERVNLGWPDIRTVSTARPRADGTIDQTEHYGARAVSIDLTAVNEQALTWKHALAVLARMIAVRERPTLVLTVGGIAYRMGLAPDQASAPFEFGDHAKVQLTFRAPDPFLYTPLQVVATGPYEVSSTGRTYSTVYPPGRVFPVSTAVSGLLPVTNGGAVDVWPLLRVRGPLATSFRIEDMATGEAFAMTSITIDAGQFLEVNMLTRTVRINGDPNLPRFSLIDFTASTWLRAQPGENTFRFVTGAAAPGAIAEIEWADPFLWPDDTEDP
jgi:hypothetical protein